MMQALVSSVVDAKKASTAQCCRALGVSRSGLYAMASKAKRFQGGVRGIRNTSRVFKFDSEWFCAKIFDPWQMPWDRMARTSYRPKDAYSGGMP